MSDASKDILIVGGGIGGLTLALSLHAVGLGDRVHLFDSVPELKPVGGRINLGPHAVKVLTELGLEEALLNVSKRPYDCDPVEKLSGDKPFARIEDVIAPEELRNLFANYQKVAGYHVDVVGKR